MTQQQIQERARQIAHICDGNVVLYDDRIEYDIIKLVNDALSECKVTPEQINEAAAKYADKNAPSDIGRWIWQKIADAYVAGARMAVNSAKNG